MPGQDPQSLAPKSGIRGCAACFPFCGVDDYIHDSALRLKCILLLKARTQHCESVISRVRGMDGQAQCSSPPQQVLRDLSDSGEVLQVQAKAMCTACESQFGFLPGRATAQGTRGRCCSVLRTFAKERPPLSSLPCSRWVAREVGAEEVTCVGSSHFVAAFVSNLPRRKRAI